MDRGAESNGVIAMEEDTIIIHLGKVVSQAKYDEIVKYIISCLNKKYPEINNILES